MIENHTSGRLSRPASLRRLASVALGLVLLAGSTPGPAQWPQPGKQRKPGPATGAPSSGPKSAVSGGCAISGFGGLGGAQGIFPWTGDPRVDGAYQREGLYLVQLFGVSPAGAFLDDRAGPNAYATPERHFPNGPDGTVLFGVTLMQLELERDGGSGLAVPAIMAHEFGHIVQLKDPRARTQPTPLRELHADFLAGWYLVKRSHVLPTDVGPALASFFEKGDYDFNDSRHHGTPEQRLAALTAGMNSGASTIHAAYQAGWDYLSRTTGQAELP